MVFGRVRDLITGLVYHDAVAVFCFVLSLALCTTEIYIFINEHNGNELEVSFLDVGQGDSILITTPQNHLVLIDGGPPTSEVLSEIGKVIPFYRRRIDIVIATHPDADHIGGLPKVIQKYKPTLLLESGIHVDTWIDQSLMKKVEENNTDVLRARKGMKIYFDEYKHTELEILFPDRNVDGWVKNTNDASIVSRLKHKNVSFLSTGDAPMSIEEYLLPFMSHTDVIKVGHHGSKTSTAKSFVKKLTPTFSVVSAGKKNRYGHPNENVISLLNSENTNILETSKCGTITFKSDGVKLLPIDGKCVLK